jgi:multisubunit Na+/H+ antiporter MnhG subunit
LPGFEVQGEKHTFTKVKERKVVFSFFSRVHANDYAGSLGTAAHEIGSFFLLFFYFSLSFSMTLGSSLNFLLLNIFICVTLFINNHLVFRSTSEAFQCLSLD